MSSFLLTGSCSFFVMKMKKNNHNPEENLNSKIESLQKRISWLESSETMYKLAEEKLKKIEFQQRAILNNIPDIAWLKDKESKFIAVNEPFGKACGVRPEDLIGKADLDIWPRDLAERYRKDDQEVMKSGLRKRVEEPLADKEGKIKWIETIKTPIYNDKGQIIGTTGIARDITERKEIEERLRESRAELEIRVKVRTAELSKTNEDLHREVVLSKRIEGELKESEAKFRAIAENSLIGVGIVQGDRVVYANRSAAEIFDYKINELIGIETFLLVATEDRKIISELADKRIRGEHVPSVFEFKALKKNGSKFDAQLSSSVPIKINGFPSMVIAIQDITARNRAQQELQENERFLYSVFSSIQDGISVLDKEMNIVRVNHTMENWYKHAMPLVGKKCFEAYHGRKERCKVCPSYKTLQTGESEFEVVPKTGKDKEVVGWLDLYSYPLIDITTGKLSGVIEYVRDISGRRNAEEKLRESEALYRAVVESQTELIVRFKSDGIINFANEACSNYLGKSQDELIGKDFFALVTEDDRKKVKKALSKLTRNNPIVKLEHRIVSADNSIRWHECTSCAIFNDEFILTEYQVVSRDITDFRKK